MTALNNQTVGQSLTLQCEVTTMGNITSSVDIVWSSGGTELQRMNNVSSTMMSNSLMYTNSFTISPLTKTDDGRVIQCEGVINAIPSVMASDDITLDITGMFIVTRVPLVVNFSNSLLLYTCTINSLSVSMCILQYVCPVYKMQ